MSLPARRSSGLAAFYGQMFASWREVLTGMLAFWQPALVDESVEPQPLVLLRRRPPKVRRSQLHQLPSRAATGVLPVAAPRRAMGQDSTQPVLDVERVRLALDGNPQAVQQLVDAVTPVVQARVARALLRRPQSRGRDIAQEVADLSQDVFVALFSDDAKALRAWQPTLGLSLINFVGLLAERRAASLLRTKSRAPWSEEAAGDELDPGATSEGLAPDAELVSRDMLARLIEALQATLSERGLQLFYRLYVDQEAIEDVCAQTGLSAAAVYQWKSRLGTAAREALTDLQRERRVRSSGAAPRPGSAAASVDRGRAKRVSGDDEGMG